MIAPPNVQIVTKKYAKRHEDEPTDPTLNLSIVINICGLLKNGPGMDYRADEMFTLMHEKCLMRKQKEKWGEKVHTNNIYAVNIIPNGNAF